MRQYLVTIGVLTTALACYVAGFSLGAVVLAGLAIVGESAFWIRVWMRRRVSGSPEPG